MIFKFWPPNLNPKFVGVCSKYEKKIFNLIAFFLTFSWYGGGWELYLQALNFHLLFFEAFKKIAKPTNLTLNDAGFLVN